MSEKNNVGKNKKDFTGLVVNDIKITHKFISSFANDYTRNRKLPVFSYNCECSLCNKKFIRSSKSVHSKNVSCDCLGLSKFIGQKFNKLQIIEIAPSYKYTSKTGKKSSRRKFKCLCDCGKTVTVDSNKIRLNKVTQCQSCSYAGRPQSTRRQTAIERVFNNHVVRRAKRAGIEIKITVLEYQTIINNNCYYCGTPPKDYNVYNNKFSKSEIIKFNGVDRVNSDGDYSLDNCVACCKMCNTMKMDSTQEEFFNHIKKILKFQETK